VFLRRGTGADEVAAHRSGSGTVFAYYRRRASLSGQPGSGDIFLRELFQVSYDPSCTIRVELLAPPSYGLPNAFVTCGFDADDLIYVALAGAHPPSAVVNAVDSDYSIHAAQLASIPVQVQELCAHCLKAPD
jgi:hypothetical protein